jgi:putative peptide maturation system protein
MPVEEALLHAVSFLKSLPRTRGLEENAWARLAAFRAAHPDVAIDLVIDRPPGCPHIDFDLLLRDLDGTIAVGWRPDGGIPWSVRYSEHWASNLVLSVNDFDVTIQDALLMLRLNEEDASDLMTRLVDHCLIAATILKDPPPVSDTELQDAADRFRSARGLHSSDATQRWLSDSGISMERFEALLKSSMQERKLEERITANRVPDYYSDHTDSLGTVAVFRLHSASKSSLIKLTADNKRGLTDAAWGSLTSEAGTLLKVSALTGFPEIVLPSFVPGSTALRPGAIIGPVKHRAEYWCGQILQCFPPQLNQATYAFIQQRLFASWLQEQREAAKIRWHWI